MVEDYKLSRRDFLKGSAATGAALSLGVYGGNAALAEPKVIGANNRILVGIIGCGNKGTSHLRGLVQKSKNEGKVAVVAVCDIYERRKQRAKEISGAEVYHDYRKLLERKDIDAVVIATPDHWHAPMAIDAMQAGKDVYLEKPMTYTWEEAKKVAQVAKETNRVLQVGAQSCSDDRWWQANKLIKEGAIGKVLWTSASFCRNSVKGEWNYPIDEDASPDNLDWNAWLGPAPKREFDKERYFRWRKYWDYSGGIATDLFYHTLSHLQIALGPEFPKRVSAGGGIYVQHDRDVPDTFHMIIDYPSDHSIVLCSSMANRQGITEMIRGHEATMYFEEPGVVIRPENEFKDLKQEIRVALNERPSHMDNWLDCIRTRNKPHLDADTAYKVMVAIALGVESYRKEKVMRFDSEKEEVV
ncbi:MAG: Gfo/Idh/MocA family oxidoreductase [Armatimonadetes bacterium]|nr:Gfo/Idh/MocA family oxidoreductase [Armatimonadota bacterium]